MKFRPNQLSAAGSLSPAHSRPYTGAAAFVLAALCTAGPLNAASITWTGGSSTNFETPGNWTGATTPPTNDLTTDIALFTGTVTANQPVLSSSRSITGLSLNTAGGGWTLGSASGSNVLTLGASGIASTNTSGTNTISANLAFGASQTLLAGTGGILSLTGGLSTSLATAVVSIGSPSNAGAVVFNPGTGNTVAISGNLTNFGVQAVANGTLVLGGDGSTYGAKTTSTNSIANAGGGGALNVATGGTLLVNSGVWNVGELGRNTGTSMTGTVNVSGGTLSIGGMRYTGTNAAINVNGGALIFNNSNSTAGGGRFTFGTNTTTGTAALNLSSGLIDLSKANTSNGIGSTTAANTETVLFNQTGGVFRNGVSTGSAGVTQTGFNIGNVALGTGSNAVTLAGGTMQVFGTLAASTVGSGGINNFNFMGGTLTAGAINATNFGSSATATGSSNQVASSTNIGTLVNYGGTLAPGGLVYSSSTNSTGDVTLTSVATAGRTAITGGYTQTANGILAINLGSTTIGTGFQSGAAFYDTVSLTGALTLGGRLNVSLINSFTPTSANTFNIITGATSNSGTFSNVNSATNRVNAAGGGSFVFTRGATSTLTGYSAGADLIWAGDGSTNAWDTATSNWTKGGVASAFSNTDYVTFDETGSKSPAVALNSTLSPTSVFFTNTSGTYTIGGSGKISGAATVTVQGSGGTVALNTANDYSGSTSVAAGTLKLGDATALGNTAAGTTVTSGAVLDLNGQAVGAEGLAINGTGISSGGALINSSGTAASLSGGVALASASSIGGSGNFTLSGTMTGAFNLIKSGAGTVTLTLASGRITAAGTTQIDGGVLRIQSGTALNTLASTVTTINNGGTLELNGGITLDQPIALNNGGTVRSDGTNASNGKITISNAVAANSVTLSTVGAADVFTVGNGNNDISGGNGTDDTINVSGPGTVVLANASDYIGNWSFNAGTTRIGSATALGATAASTITLNGGALNGRLAGSTAFTLNPITVTANSSLNADRSSNGAGVNYTFGTLSIGAHTLNTTSTAAVTSGTGGVIVGATTLTGNAAFNVTNGATAATTLTLGGIVTGSSFGITKSGSGALSLLGVNTYSGGTTVNNGTLNVGGTATNTGTTITGSATGTGNVTFANGTSLNNASTTTWFAPTITLAGAGSTLNLIGTSRLVVAYGVLDLGDTSRSGATTINVNGFSKAVTGGNTLSLETTGQWGWEVANTVASGGAATIQNGTLDLETTTFSGTNYGMHFIRSTNFNNADIIIGNNIILGASGGSALGSTISNSVDLTVNGSGILNMLATGKTIKSLSGSGNIFNSMIAANTAASTLNIIGTSGSTNFSGVISNGPGSGALALSKSGASTQILSGTNTYTGTTAVRAGALLIGTSGSLANTAVTVGGTGATGTPTLGGGGTIGGATTIAAAGSGVVGTHSPGVTGVSNGVGTQTFSSTLDYGTGSIFEWSLQAASTSDPGAVSNASTGTYDKVVAGGAVTGTGAVFKIVLGGNDFTDAFWNTDKTWTDIFSGAGTPSNLASIFTTFSGTNVNMDGTVIGNSGRHFTFNGTSTLTWSAVPEPTSALAGLLIAAGLMRRRRNA